MIERIFGFNAFFTLHVALTEAICAIGTVFIAVALIDGNTFIVMADETLWASAAWFCVVFIASDESCGHKADE